MRRKTYTLDELHRAERDPRCVDVRVVMPRAETEQEHASRIARRDRPRNAKRVRNLELVLRWLTPGGDTVVKQARAQESLRARRRAGR